jgi:hypothetical protein
VPVSPKSDGGAYEETAQAAPADSHSAPHCDTAGIPADFIPIVGLTSIATNLLATVFLFGSLAGWIANAPSNLIFQTAGLGIFFAFAPHIAGWLLGKATDLTLVLLDFLLV